MELLFDVSDETQLDPVIRALQPFFCRGTVVLIGGELGAGKTTFVRCFLRAQGVEEVVSPTYAFHLSYQSMNLPIHHFDLYRVDSEEELESTGFWDFFSARESFIIVEWPQKVSKASWPLNWRVVQLDIEGVPKGRRFKLRYE
jgi:tRNA threonylcarbamoyladenosine biosynthesis protein TsaE